MVDESQGKKEKPYNELSADEVYEKSKRTAGKGVAAAAGSMEGFNEKMEEKQVGAKAKEALQKTGQTTREVAGTATEEFQKTKQHLKGEGPEAVANRDE